VEVRDAEEEAVKESLAKAERAEETEGIVDVADRT